ncbi:MAG TPA: hypothetical protein VD838_16970 [Anaeromyxobacteraceae bacterium]|nr:hypothetical protein [Anaeromyxobacteraceae bacterium]
MPTRVLPFRNSRDMRFAWLAAVHCYPRRFLVIVSERDSLLVTKTSVYDKRGRRGIEARRARMAA